MLKSWAASMAEADRKRLEKQDRKFLKMEAGWLKSAPLGEYVVTRVTTPLMKVLVARGWEVAAFPNQARVSYTLRIPRDTLEARING